MGWIPTTPIFLINFLPLQKKYLTMAKKQMIKEYGGKEVYASKKQMVKHEKAEGKKVEKMEKKGVFPKMKKK